MIALDTNLLIYAHRAGCPEHMAARAAIERASRAAGGCGIPQACVAEFLSQVTHPRYPGGASPLPLAKAFLANLLRDGEIRILSAGPNFTGRLLESAVQLNVTGARVFDLQIALMALDGGARALWSHDRHFLAPPELIIEDPLP